ncbi:SCO family protein [Brevibacillus nitrificans]|uniref:SCO family protein n=1 Tax=Brevibacillus nitrificans TaxID=651560 RepID=A0A3M8D282_9BACL|nr:SCO family protein [Brevibacillus nitrificans]RNB81809.1 SCO family protein [Brevibacillus nitrificans]
MPEATVNAIRLKRVLLLLPVLVLVALVSSWFWGDSQQAKAALPSLTLETLDGKPYPLSASPGKTRLVELIYTRCPDVCPTTTFKMVQLQKRLTDAGVMGKNVEFLTITIDPQNDTADVLQRYADQLQIQTQGWTILRGDESTIQSVTRSLGFVARKSADGFISHTTSTYLVNANNEVIRTFGMGDDFNTDLIYQELVSKNKEGL